MVDPSQTRLQTVSSGTAKIIARLRNSFALDYEAARLSAHDVMVNFLALSRVARSSAEDEDFDRATQTASALCVLAENLALSKLADVARAYMAACEDRDVEELQITTKRVLGELAKFGISEVSLEQHQPEDEI
jgi:galactokinase